VQVYLGSTRDTRFVALMRHNIWGECFVAGGKVKAPLISPTMVDNGAYGAWRSGNDWDGVRFLKSLDSIDRLVQFIVCPDIVGAGDDSLRHSLRHFYRVRPHGPVYLAVQDGMSVNKVIRQCENGLWAGLFVGGTKKWKWQTARQWCRIAISNGMGCHIGRAATPRGMRVAFEIGATSIDGNQPLWSRRHMAVFERAYAQLGCQQYMEAAHG
jgi:hypothetical protein